MKAAYAIGAVLLLLLAAAPPGQATSITCCAVQNTPFVVDLSGQGFGTIHNILELHATNTEAGAVAWNGTADIASSADVTLGPPHSQTYTVGQLKLFGIQDASQLGLVWNINQQGGAQAQFLTLQALSLLVFDSSGTELLEIACATGGSGCPVTEDAASNNGQGQAGWLFTLNGNAQASLNALFTNDSNRIGLSASMGVPCRPRARGGGCDAQFGGSNDGADGFAIAAINQASSSPVTGVPEPASLVLLGTGLLAAGAARGRHKRN